jgi:DNA-binding LacI/PurR family transcriptional regulator
VAGSGAVDRNGATPLHRQVTNALRRSILEGGYPVGTALPSETELALAFGVSRQTIRQALGPLAGEHLLERVVGRGTFVAARRRPRTGVIACIVTRLVDEMIARLVDGAERAGRAAGLRLEVANALGDPELERRSAESAAASADGVVIFATGGTAAIATGALLQRTGTPFVLVDRGIPDLSADLVTADNVRGGALAAEHLLGLGHRQIALIRRRDDGVTTVVEREHGFLTALEEAGVPRQEVATVVAPGRMVTAWDYLRLPSLAEHPDIAAIAAGLAQFGPTAAFAVNDITALQTVLAARSLGWGVPGRLSVVGFGDDSHARTCVPALTTIRQDPSEMGRQAMDLLIARLAEPSRAATIIHLPVSFVARESSGPCPRPAA